MPKKNSEKRTGKNEKERKRKCVRERDRESERHTKKQIGFKTLKFSLILGLEKISLGERDRKGKWTESLRLYKNIVSVPDLYLW